MNGPGTSLDEQIVALETALESALKLLRLCSSAVSDLSGASRHGNRSVLACDVLHRTGRLQEVLTASRKARAGVATE